jgi:hypothetical protein
MGMSDLAIQIEEAAEKIAPGSRRLQGRIQAAIKKELEKWWREQGIPPKETRDANL